MTGLDIFALIVLLVIAGSAGFIFFLIGSWPGKVAEERNHPKKDAIKIGSWLTLVAAFPLWTVVAMWALTAPRPLQENLTADEIDSRIDGLKNKIKNLEKKKQEIGAEA
jgi:uncharacterized membrane-anchored protein